MKKVLCILTILSLAFSIAGCKNDESITDATEIVVATEAIEEAVVTKSFIGTVTEEGDAYMCVEPDKGEEERKLSDNIVVFYNYLHTDYLYGIGRRVVVYYQSDAITAAHEIFTDDISTEGFRDFELVIKENGTTKFEKVIIADGENEPVNFGHMGNVNVSTYGVEVMVKVDGKTVTLKEALERSLITPQAITAMANRDVLLNQAKETIYRDGGSCEYTYDNYKIIKYSTTEGKHDLYIGTLNMKYSR